jgi:hypothetical protein
MPSGILILIQPPVAWATRQEEFVWRAGYVLMAVLAVHDKKAPNERFLPCLDLIKAGATDERNFVKKAVNWTLRQIGKRHLALDQRAPQTAQDICQMEARAARRIASDALRDLTSAASRSGCTVAKCPPSRQPGTVRVYCIQSAEGDASPCGVTRLCPQAEGKTLSLRQVNMSLFLARSKADGYD